MALRNNVQSLLDIATEKFQQEWIERYEYWFERKWNENESQNFINSKEGSKLHAKLKENKTQLELFINGNVKNWDLTLLQISFTQTDWPKTMKLTKKQQSRMKSLLEIIEIRNRFAHNSFHASNENLNSDLEKLKKILIDDLGFDSEMIEDQIKTSKSNVNHNFDKFEIEDSSNDSKASELREKANKLFGEKKWIEALKIYNEALGLDKISISEKAKLYSNRSATHVQLRQFEAALDDAEQSIILLPDWFRGYERKGDALFSMFKYDDAKKEFEYSNSLNRDPKLQFKISNCESEKSKADRYEHLNKDFNTSFTDEWKILKEQMNLPENINLKDFVEQLKFHSEKGNMSAHVQLALMYIKGGIGIVMDPKKGVKMLEEAAQKNNAEALYNLALCYLNGVGVKKDLKHAWELLNRAIQQPEIDTQFKIRNPGVAEAYQAIGNHYSYGKIPLQKNHSMAFKNYKKSADLGYYVANNDLGVCFNNGYGVEVDFVKALQYYELAASHGHIIAIGNAASMYFEGLGCPGGIPNIPKAVEILKPCAEKGYPPAVQLLKHIESLFPNIEDLGIPTQETTDFANSSFSKLFNKVGNFKEQQQSKKHLENRVGHLIDYRELHQFVNNGSRFAMRICEAQIAFLECKFLIEKGVKDGHLSTMRTIVKKISEAIQKFELVVLIHEISDELMRIISILEKSDFAENSPDFYRDILVCRACLCKLPIPGEIKPHPETVIRFLNQTCLNSFPTDTYFLSLVMLANGVAERDERALKAFERINKNDITIDNCDIYFFAAVCQVNLNQNPSENMRKFLSMCAKDDRKRPGAFYMLACYQFQKNPLQVDIIMKLYEEGLEAEKDQLPPFLPYKEGRKQFLEELILPMIQLPKRIGEKQPKSLPSSKVKNSTNNNNNHTANWNSFSSLDSKLRDPRRIQIILANREGFDKRRNFVLRSDECFMDTGRTIPYYASDSKSSLLNLSEMTTHDHTYSNRKFVGRFIGCFYKIDAVYNVIEDIDRNVKRIVFYNVPESEWNERFRIGNLIEIINPHLRMALDKKEMIRVDNPKSWKVLKIKKFALFVDVY